MQGGLFMLFSPEGMFSQVQTQQCWCNAIAYPDFTSNAKNGGHGAVSAVDDMMSLNGC